MGFPKFVRLHYGQGSMKTESFANFCRANGNLTRQEGVALLESWLKSGALKQRRDGGFDVIHAVPRQFGPQRAPVDPSAAESLQAMKSILADRPISHNDVPGDELYDTSREDRRRASLSARAGQASLPQMDSATQKAVRNAIVGLVEAGLADET